MNPTVKLFRWEKFFHMPLFDQVSVFESFILLFPLQSRPTVWVTVSFHPFVFLSFLCNAGHVRHVQIFEAFAREFFSRALHHELALFHDANGVGNFLGAENVMC